jgi:NADP-dependent 3-hydroxy acid dehydrogenase YdfG
VVITGASSGIGAATARAFGSAGARVVLAARSIEKLEKEAAQIAAGGGQALPVEADVTNPAHVVRLLEATNDMFGPVDVLVNNAGSNWRTPFSQTTMEEIAYALQVNLLGAMQLTGAVLPDMLRRGTGTIVCVASVAGHVAIEPVYSAAKFGLLGFSLALRRQLAGSGIVICVISPGNVRTAMTSGIRQALPGPEVVANAIVGVVLRPRREVVVPSRYRALIWLDQLLPDLADFAFRWRHRRDRDPRCGEILPAYATSRRRTS